MSTVNSSAQVDCRAADWAGLNDKEFIEAINPLVAQGRNRRVRTYERIFSVMVWDKTPDQAKKRWKDARDRIIESSFGAYTVQDLEWKGVE